MYTKDYLSTVLFLMEQYCMPPENAIFVDNIMEICRVAGCSENDPDKPLKFVAQEPGGCRMLIRNYIPEQVLRQRRNALSVRNQMTNVAIDRADALDSGRKQLAYLFLSEYALSLSETAGDERLADDWAFDEMKRLGFFKS